MRIHINCKALLPIVIIIVIIILYILKTICLWLSPLAVRIAEAFVRVKIDS